MVINWVNKILRSPDLPHVILLAAVCSVLLTITFVSRPVQSDYSLRSLSRRNVHSKACATPTEKEHVETANFLVDRMFNNVSFKDPRLEVIDYLIAPDPWFCVGSAFVVVIPMNVDDVARRTEYRSTYASSSYKQKYKYALLFAVGLSKSEDIQRKLHIESERYGDILQADFQDVYHNLTRKMLSAFRFVVSSCRQIKAIVKVDDDIGWNIKQVKDFVMDSLEHDKIYGLRDATNKPERSQKYPQWKLTEEEWSRSNLPVFCRGMAYVIPRQVAETILSVVPYQKFLKLEDVFITGVLAEAARINISHLGTDRITLAQRNPKVHEQISFTFFKIKRTHHLFWFLKVNSDISL